MWATGGYQHFGVTYRSDVNLLWVPILYIYIYYMYIANHYKLVESSGERLMRKQCSAELSSLGHSSIRT